MSSTTRYKLRKAQRGYGIMLVIIFVMVSVLTVVSLQMTGAGNTAFYRSTVQNVSAISLARTAMTIIRADIYNKLVNGLTVDTSYTYPLTTINVPADPTTMSGSASVGTYSGFVKYVSGNSYLVQVTASVGGISYTYAEPFTVKGAVVYPLDPITSATPVAAYSVRRLRKAYTGPALRVQASDGYEFDVGFTPAGDLDQASAIANLTTHWTWQTSPPLDLFGAEAGVSYPYTAAQPTPGAIGAYGMRRLSSSYSGSVLKVRRSSDNTCQDIGFDANGDLDVAAMLAFVGSGNGFVQTWYDQSGNGRNLSRGTLCNDQPTKQPQIVSSGAVMMQNGRPSMWFDGNSGHSLVRTGTTGANGIQSVYASMVAGVVQMGNDGVLLAMQDDTLDSDYINSTSTHSVLMLRHMQGLIEPNFRATAVADYSSYRRADTVDAQSGKHTLEVFTPYVYSTGDTTTGKTYANLTVNQASNSGYYKVPDNSKGMQLNAKRIMVGSDYAASVGSGRNWKGYISEILIFHDRPPLDKIQQEQIQYYNMYRNGMGYIVKWYDQSGNGKDLSVDTVGDPVFYPFLYAPKQDRWGLGFNHEVRSGMTNKTITGMTGNLQRMTAFGIAMPSHKMKFDSNTWASQNNACNYGPCYVYSRILSANRAGDPNDWNTTTGAVLMELLSTVNNTQPIVIAEHNNLEYNGPGNVYTGRTMQMTSLWDGTNVTVRSNGTAGASSAYNGGPFNIQHLRIGGSITNGSTETFDGSIHEIILYATDLSSGDITYLEGNERSYFNTP